MWFIVVNVPCPGLVAGDRNSANLSLSPAVPPAELIQMVQYFENLCYISRKPDIIATMSSLKFAIPSLTELHTIVEEKFNIHPCIFQAHAVMLP